ncbi:MAG: HD domain-containing protein [Alphaproteobacteria bacterium]
MAEELAKFHQMTEGTAEDYAIVAAANAEHVKALPDRIVAHLMLLDGDHGGFAVDRLEHCLQTATRAHQAGENEEYVVAALLHDMGDVLCPSNHADMAATILKPFVDEDIHWMVEQHAIFQGYYFFDFLGLDKNMRDQFKGHPCFEKTAQFCHLYDQNSFDPSFKSMKLEDFRPMLNRVFERPKNSIYLRDAAE